MNEQELKEVTEMAALVTLTEWPITNTVGSCWCGHSKEGHSINVDDHCLTCQCVGFYLDTWGVLNA